MTQSKYLNNSTFCWKDSKTYQPHPTLNEKLRLASPMWTQLVCFSPIKYQTTVSIYTLACTFWLFFHLRVEQQGKLSAFQSVLQSLCQHLITAGIPQIRSALQAEYICPLSMVEVNIFWENTHKSWPFLTKISHTSSRTVRIHWQQRIYIYFFVVQ